MYSESDAALIAHAPTALRQLVDEVRRLEHSLADAMEQIAAIQGASDRVAELQATITTLKKSDTAHRRRIAADALELERLRAEVAGGESGPATSTTTCGPCCHYMPADKDGPQYCHHPDKADPLLLEGPDKLPNSCPRRTWTLHKVETT